jgi:hypothetical protein
VSVERHEQAGEAQQDKPVINAAISISRAVVNPPIVSEAALPLRQGGTSPPALAVGR